METYPLEKRMLADTLGLFGSGRDASAITQSPDQGLLLIEGWLNALRGDGPTSAISAELAELRTHLRSERPDQDRIRQLLMNLAGHTDRITKDPAIDPQTSSQLKQLVDSLRNLGSQF